jgi:hypothetical protein
VTSSDGPDITSTFLYIDQEPLTSPSIHPSKLKIVSSSHPIAGDLRARGAAKPPDAPYSKGMQQSFRETVTSLIKALQKLPL